MELLANLGLGLSVALSPENLLYCFLGTLFGTLIGVLPGIGPLPTIAILLPITFTLEPTGALIMLAGIYYGAQYGGSTTAILVNVPGEASSVVATLDGHQMAKQGRAGAALAIAALGSLFAGCFATLLIAGAAPAMTAVALRFGAAEYFSLMVLGLVAAILMAGGSAVKAVGMTLLGILLGLIGTDLSTGQLRYTFGVAEFSNGLDFAVVAMGLFGIGEIIRNLEHPDAAPRDVSRNVGRLWPTAADFRAAWKPVLRGTGLGSVLGILPGGGAILSSFASYSLERRLSSTPERFGKGAIEGLAGPEAANNAGSQASFIPLLTLGLPGNAVLALMAGAMIIHGIIPGPNVMTSQPDLFWGLIASMWIGNVMLVILNLPLIGLWTRLLVVPYRWLCPAIVAFCCIGVFSLETSMVNVLLLAVFGVLGYFFIRLACEPAPLLLGFVLGPLMEENFRRALALSRNDPSVFLTRPISAGLLIAALALLALLLVPTVMRTREEAFKGEAV